MPELYSLHEAILKKLGITVTSEVNINKAKRIAEFSQKIDVKISELQTRVEAIINEITVSELTFNKAVYSDSVGYFIDSKNKPISENIELDKVYASVVKNERQYFVLIDENHFESNKAILDTAFPINIMPEFYIQVYSALLEYITKPIFSHDNLSELYQTFDNVKQVFTNDEIAQIKVLTENYFKIEMKKNVTKKLFVDFSNNFNFIDLIILLDGLEQQIDSINRNLSFTKNTHIQMLGEFQAAVQGILDAKESYFLSENFTVLDENISKLIEELEKQQINDKKMSELKNKIKTQITLVKNSIPNLMHFDILIDELKKLDNKLNLLKNSSKKDRERQLLEEIKNQLNASLNEYYENGNFEEFSKQGREIITNNLNSESWSFIKNIVGLFFDRYEISLIKSLSNIANKEVRKCKNNARSFLNNENKILKEIISSEFIKDSVGEYLRDNVSLNKVLHSLETKDGKYTLVLDESNNRAENTLKELGFPTEIMGQSDIIVYAAILKGAKQQSVLKARDYTNNIFETEDKAPVTLNAIFGKFNQKLDSEIVPIVYDHFISRHGNWYKELVINLSKLQDIHSGQNIEEDIELNESQILDNIEKVIQEFRENNQNKSDYRLKILENLGSKLLRAPFKLSIHDISIIQNQLKKLSIMQSFSEHLSKLEQQLQALPAGNYEITLQKLFNTLNNSYNTYCQDGEFEEFLEIGIHAFIYNDQEHLNIHTSGFYKFLQDYGLLNLVKSIMKFFKSEEEVELMFAPPAQKISKLFFKEPPKDAPKEHEHSFGSTTDELSEDLTDTSYPSSHDIDFKSNK